MLNPIEVKRIVTEALDAKKDPHQAVADHFGITRTEAKRENFAHLYGIQGKISDQFFGASPEHTAAEATAHAFVSGQQLPKDEHWYHVFCEAKQAGFDVLVRAVSLRDEIKRKANG